MRVALSALLMLVVALAPIEARFVMAAHVHAAPHEVAANDTHNHAAAKLPGGHDHHLTEHALVGKHVAQTTADSSDVPPHGHNDHGKADGGCCGTFCHSACVQVVATSFERSLVSMTFDDSAVAALAATDPGQLQRPPSHLLSI